MGETVIRAMCERCGEQDLAPEDVHLQTYDRGGRDFYEFICPDCCEIVVRHAGDIAIAALRTGRVPETRIFLPAEALDPIRNDQTELTNDTMLDFIIALERAADPMRELLAEG